MKKLITLFIVITLFSVTGCTSPPRAEKPPSKEASNRWLIYEDKSIRFTYPPDYKILKKGEDGLPAIRIYKNEPSTIPRLEIFKLSDFGGDRPFGFTGEETQEDIDNYVPKQKRAFHSRFESDSPENTFHVWLYHSEYDFETRDFLNRIADTIVLK